MPVGVTCMPAIVAQRPSSPFNSVTTLEAPVLSRVLFQLSGFLPTADEEKSSKNTTAGSAAFRAAVADGFPATTVSVKDGARRGLYDCPFTFAGSKK